MRKYNKKKNEVTPAILIVFIGENENISADDLVLMFVASRESDEMLNWLSTKLAPSTMTTPAQS
jgi:hypothetical protein